MEEFSVKLNLKAIMHRKRMKNADVPRSLLIWLVFIIFTSGFKEYYDFENHNSL
jgi:hypothetical protein